MKTIVIAIAVSSLLVAPMPARAQNTVYTPADSLKISALLSNAPVLGSSNEYMMYFGTWLSGTPYGGQTLDKNPAERLAVNTSRLDCTTFVETVLALTLCMKNGKRSFGDFTHYLRLVRYKDGNVAYETRLHYFSVWNADNTKKGFVVEETGQGSPSSLFSCTQTLDLSYMTTHTALYPALRKDASMAAEIREMEKSLSGTAVKYIPKSSLTDYNALKSCIRSGDIIAIVTSKKGLDVSHLGIASWHPDGTLHLLNASQIRKKVINEPMTLYEYMQQHPSQLGIRVIRPL